MTKLRLFKFFILSVFLIISLLSMILVSLINKEIKSNESQIRFFIQSASSRDLSEGNYFRVGEILTTLSRSGQILCAEVKSDPTDPVVKVPPNTGCSNVTENFDENWYMRVLNIFLPLTSPMQISSSAGTSLVINLIPKLNRTLIGSLISLLSLSLAAVIAIILWGIISILIFRKRQVKTLDELIESLPKLDWGLAPPGWVINDFPELVSVWQKTAADLKVLKENFANLEAQKRLGEIARQVAHDIRSPITALNFALAKEHGLSDEKRVLVQSAIKRINDIASSLLSLSRTNYIEDLEKIGDKREVHFIPDLVKNLVLEKSAEYQDKICIDYDMSENESALYAKVEPSVLKRVLSNLINNSVEALPAQGGKVSVKLTSESDQILIEILDNGRGIPTQILSKLGAAGQTYGKENSSSGSGLGLYHAKAAMSALGGNFSINSIDSFGTTVLLSFPSHRT